jgi:hypothetical protein
LQARKRVYINLLKVSALWQIDIGKDYTINELELMYLTPTRRLEFAKMFGIYHWVEPAITEIYQGNLSVLSDSDLERIGLKVYSILVRGMEVLQAKI